MIAPLAVLLAAAGPVAPPDGGTCLPSGNEIVVCRRRPGGDSRYRLPLRDEGFDPDGLVDSVAREHGRLIDGDGAAPDMTRGSCSAAGADGSNGCMVKAFRERRQQRSGR